MARSRNLGTSPRAIVPPIYFFHELAHWSPDSSETIQLEPVICHARLKERYECLGYVIFARHEALLQQWVAGGQSIMKY